MGVLLALPTSELFPYPHPPISSSSLSSSPISSNSAGGSVDEEREEEEGTAASTPVVYDRETIRAYMREHSVRGTKMAKARQPYVGEILNFDSPVDPDVEFGIRRIGNREHLQYQNMTSKVRYYEEEENSNIRVVTERDFPMGSMKVQTIMLALARWNIEDASGKPVEITEDHLRDFTQPEELDFLHEKVLEVNPILAGASARKNS